MLIGAPVSPRLKNAPAGVCHAVALGAAACSYRYSGSSDGIVWSSAHLRPSQQSRKPSRRWQRRCSTLRAVEWGAATRQSRPASASRPRTPCLVIGLGVTVEGVRAEATAIAVSSLGRWKRRGSGQLPTPPTSKATLPRPRQSSQAPAVRL